MFTTGRVFLSDAIFLSLSGEGRRLRERADVSVYEVAAAAGIDVLKLLRWETGQLVPAGPQSGDWACVVRVLRRRNPEAQQDGSGRYLDAEIERNTSENIETRRRGSGARTTANSATLLFTTPARRPSACATPPSP